MPEGRRYSPDNPSPTAVSLASYIRDKGVEIEDKHVAAVWFYHPEWQPGHAEQVRQERAAGAAEREAAKAQKAQEREAKKAEREEKKAKAEQEREAKKAEREAKKAEKAAAAEGADGEEADTEGDAPRSKRRLRTSEPVAAGNVGASAQSF